MCLFYFAFARVTSLHVSMVYGLDLHGHEFYSWGDTGRNNSLRRHWRRHLCSMKFSKITCAMGSDPGYHQLDTSYAYFSSFPSLEL